MPATTLAAATSARLLLLLRLRACAHVCACVRARARMCARVRAVACVRVCATVKPRLTSTLTAWSEGKARTSQEGDGGMGGSGGLAF